MPRYKDHEKNRLKNARLKKLSLLPKNKKLKRPSDPDQAKDWLHEVADHLSNYPNAGPSFRFVAFAIKRFLRKSDARDLSKELGLINPVGRPSSFQARMKEREQGRKIVMLKDAGKPWHLIGKVVGLTDKRSLKRLYDKYSVLHPKEKQLAELDCSMKKFFEEETLHRLKSS